jgi:UDP:flavonoid glycosyltransferase YjiC (YdhE family)
MAAVVHHCGAGTTGAGLRAGVPAVPVPIQFDEGFWAARLAHAGVAPAVLHPGGLTADTLASALTRAVREPAFRERARDLGARVRAEDGFAPVLEAVNRVAG